MLRNTLKGLDTRRLRRWLLAFFLALAIPTGVLIVQAYSQLKWEAFHLHQRLAEELAARIDNRLAQLIRAEEARRFTDYAFLNVAGDESSNLLQRSPLSGFPVNTDVPGLIGYFQVDSDGGFSTPLLPANLTDASRYGVAQTEQQQRQQLQDRIHQILSQNRLVATGKTDSTERRLAEIRKRRAAEARQRQRQSSLMDLGKREASEPADKLVAMAPGAGEVMEGEMAADEMDAGMANRPGEEALPTKAGGKDAEMAFADDAPAEAVIALNEAPVQAYEPVSQAAFERLNAPRPEAEKKLKASSKLGRVEDLKLEPRYEQQQAMQMPDIAASAPAARRAQRKEQNILPEPQMDFDIPASGGISKGDLAGVADIRTDSASTRITTFESEIDPFEISLLDSGHFVLFRKVWRNGERFIQGMLIEQQPFLHGVIEPMFRSTALSQMSDLIVAYRGDVFSAFSGLASIRYLSSAEELSGALLYQGRLSAPLSEMELIFSVNRLPAGPGGRVILWVAAILLLVLCGGFYLLYRLGLGQIHLARQQQDFVSAVSHELKTPLTSIRMYGEMLRAGWADEAKKKDYYDYIYDESERLTRLINNVLQLARMTRNEIAVELQAVSVTELIDGIRSKIGSQVEHAGFELHIDCDAAASQAMLQIDPDWFTQIIINLVDNAIKFSSKADNKRIDIGCQRISNRRIQFTIRDYGPGIARDQMKKIFKLFYRSENELTRETVGTGIGLALVHQLTTAMEGEIDVVNREPGAAFVVIFRLTSD